MVLLDEADGSAEPFPSVLPKGFRRVLESAVRRSTPVHNEFLKMKPEDIPGRYGCMYSIPSASLISLLVMFGLLDRNSKAKQVAFFVDDLCILTDDKMKTTDDECWEKLERGQGWGIPGGAGWEGWKRTFVYKPRQPSNSNKNWFLTVYAAFEGDGYVKPLYMCHVYETYNFNPRPKCVLQVSAADVDNPDTIQEDPEEVESLAKKLEGMATNPNLLPFGYGERSLTDMFWFPSFGVDKSLRAEVWKSGKFSRIKARRPDGSEICWSLCNHCGMVYKGSTLPAGLEKHKCDCRCRLAPNS